MPSGPKARKPVYPQRMPVVRSAGPGRTVGKPTDARVDGSVGLHFREFG